MESKISKPLVLGVLVFCGLLSVFLFSSRDTLVVHKSVDVYSSVRDLGRSLVSDEVLPIGSVPGDGEEVDVLKVGFDKSFKYYKIRTQDGLVGYIVAEPGVEEVKKR